MAPYLHIGWVFVLAQLGGLWLGHWLDGKFGTKPWLMVVGAFAGMAIGFVNLVQVATGAGRRKSSKQ
jgi:F0F1-type ATP synthase assembly protein I